MVAPGLLHHSLDVQFVSVVQVALSPPSVVHVPQSDAAEQEDPLVVVQYPLEQSEGRAQGVAHVHPLPPLGHVAPVDAIVHQPEVH